MAYETQQDKQFIRAPKYSQQRLNPEVPQDPEKKQRIKIWMAGCLLAVALLIDVIQLFLTSLAIGVVLAPVISVATSFLFWLWFKLLGISFVTNPKRLATFATEFWLEIFPLANAVPAWTVGTLITIIITRSEDKGGIIGKATNLAQGKIDKAA